MTKSSTAIRVADAVWIGAALLHREHPDAPDFLPGQIIARIREEDLPLDAQPSSLNAHISQHCVANIARSTGRYRMLFATSGSRRRLFRPGDPHDPQRSGKVTPVRDEVPPKYHALIDWYQTEWARPPARDPLTALATKYRDIWKPVDADEYVRQLREGWE